MIIFKEMKRIVFILFLVTLAYRLPSEMLEAKYVVSQEIQRETTPLTIENVIAELKRANVQHIDIVVRQIIWETGWFKSKRCTKYHNLFGFQKNEKGMKFDKWEDSVKYYKLWQEKKYKGGDYYSFLKRVGYAQDTSYTDSLQTLSTKKFAKFYT